MFTFILQGLTLGFAAGAQPGPFKALPDQPGAHPGLAALGRSVGSAVSDGPIVALVLLVLSQVPDWFQRVLQIIGRDFSSVYCLGSL